MELYSLKQIIGGFALVVLFITVLIINVLLKNKKSPVNTFGNQSNTLDYSRLLTPILVGITLALLVYVINLNELITIKTKLFKKADKLVMQTCPDGYEKIISKDPDTDEKPTVNCVNSSRMIPSFYLQGNDDVCAGEYNENNGCFNNRSTLRKEQCDNIKKFFETDIDNVIVNSWTEYQNNCMI